jgi:hypothetical protein
VADYNPHRCVEGIGEEEGKGVVARASLGGDAFRLLRVKRDWRGSLERFFLSALFLTKIKMLQS